MILTMGIILEESIRWYSTIFGMSLIFILASIVIFFILVMYSALALSKRADDNMRRMDIKDDNNYLS